MIKSLQKIGNSKGILIDKSILQLLKIGDDGAFEMELKDGGLFLKPLSVEGLYKKNAKKHRKSLDKLAK